MEPWVNSRWQSSKYSKNIFTTQSIATKVIVDTKRAWEYIIFLRPFKEFLGDVLSLLHWVKPLLIGFKAVHERYERISLFLETKEQ